MRKSKRMSKGKDTSKFRKKGPHVLTPEKRRFCRYRAQGCGSIWAYRMAYNHPCERGSPEYERARNINRQKIVRAEIKRQRLKRGGMAPRLREFARLIFEEGLGSIRAARKALGWKVFPGTPGYSKPKNLRCSERMQTEMDRLRWIEEKKTERRQIERTWEAYRKRSRALKDSPGINDKDNSAIDYLDLMNDPGATAAVRGRCGERLAELVGSGQLTEQVRRVALVGFENG